MDVKTFLSEQLSVEPRQLIIEEKARQIKDIILMKHLIKFNEYEIDDTLRGDENNTLRDIKSARFINDSPFDITDYVKQAEIRVVP